MVIRNKCIVGVVAPRSESKYNDCRGQSYLNTIGNLPPATFRIQPVRVNGITPYTEQCSGVDPTPSSPARGWHHNKYNPFC